MDKNGLDGGDPAIEPQLTTTTTTMRIRPFKPKNRATKGIVRNNDDNDAPTILKKKCFVSRKMLALDDRIARAIVRAREGALSKKRQRRWLVIRKTLNSYEFRRVGRSSSPPVQRITEQISEFNGVPVLMRLISTVMQDVQQRNLNAKHSATTTNRSTANGNNDDDDNNDNDDSYVSSLYIGLNRSCSQRKIVEVCCRVRIVEDASKLRKAAKFSRIVLANDDGLDGDLLYVVLERHKLIETLASLVELPKLVFVSCKNVVFRNTDENDDDDITTATTSLPSSTSHRLAYVANFVMYHAFHESDRTFDERRFGSRYRHMKILLFLLALVNAELLRVSTQRRTAMKTTTSRKRTTISASSSSSALARNDNLALNIQSLGKAYDDVGLHVFAENSIQQMRKTVKDWSESQTPRDNDTTRHSRSFATDGILVNRSLGRPSRIGINTVGLAIRL